MAEVTNAPGILIDEVRSAIHTAGEYGSAPGETRMAEAAIAAVDAHRSLKRGYVLLSGEDLKSAVMALELASCGDIHEAWVLRFEDLLRRIDPRRHRGPGAGFYDGDPDVAERRSA